MKILLINPPARNHQFQNIVVPPLGLLYIAAALKKAGFGVEVKDAFAEEMGWDAFAAYIRERKPDVTGISGMSPVIDTSFRAAAIARPHTGAIIMGGPHVSLYREKIFDQCPEIDYGVIGEGELTTPALLQAIERGEPLPDVAGIIGPGIPYRERQAIPDINDLPFPDRSLIDNRLYRYPFSRYRPLTTLFTSRGCPYGCTFCDKSTFGSDWRSRSPANVLAEIDEIVAVYGIRSFIFYDDLFTLKKDRVAAICEGILKRGYKLEWKCEGRVNLADLEMMKLMKRAGCSMIAYGVESGNQHGLDYLNKKTTPDQAVRAFDLTHRAGIKTMAYFILGIPVETYEDELETIDLAKRINATYAQFSILSPHYGTRIYEEAVQKGWYQEVDAKNPMDRDLKRPAIISDNWDEEKMQGILKTAHRQFYLRPSYIAKMLCSVQNMRQMRNYANEFFNILSWMKS
jgi:anaerobic magnesium-protoporphyrin IX monomethyl ester cyclase